MTIYVKYEISGTTIDDAYNSKVNKSISDNNASSNFSLKMDNFAGKNANAYVIGNEVKIYADEDVNPPTTNIFTGILENIEYPTNALDETVTLSGRDYTARLMDRIVEPEVYNNLPAGSIVKDIITKYVDDVTITNVEDSPTTVERVAFNNVPVYDAVKQLADLSGYTFYIDTDKDLHFFEKSTESSGYTFDSGNVLGANIKERRDTIFNEIWVYGDKYLDSFKEESVSDGAGSVVNLLYKPHNTQVDVGSPITQAVRQKGAIFGLSVLPPSGTNYLVDFNNKQLIWVSGTDIGYSSIPSSGTMITLNYQRDLPIIKVGKDNLSINNYGKRVKTIVDRKLTTPEEAQDRLEYELAFSKDPQKQGTLNLKDIINITPGQTAVIDLPNQNVDNKTYDILEATYDFNKSNNLTGNVLSIKVNKKIEDLTDIVKNLIQQVKTIQTQDNLGDILSRFEFTTGSLTITQSGTIVQMRSITGNNLILDSPTFGIIDSIYTLASGITQSFVLGKNLSAILGTTALGENLSDYVTVWSGNYY